MNIIPCPGAYLIFNERVLLPESSVRIGVSLDAPVRKHQRCSIMVAVKSLGYIKAPAVRDY